MRLICCILPQGRTPNVRVQLCMKCIVDQTRSKLKWVFPNLVFSVNHLRVCRSLHCGHCGSQDFHQQANSFGKKRLYLTELI